MERIAVLGVADRELEDILQAPGSELAEEEEPAAEGPRDARREHAGSRDQVVPELMEPLDRRGRRSDALTTQHQRFAAIGRPEDRRNLAAGPVQVRLDDLEAEPGRDGCVEGVAAALEDRHPRLGCKPVRRCDHPEGAAQLRASSESQGRTTKYALNGSCSSRCTSTEVNPASASSSRAFCSPHIAPSPSPPWASETVMQCMHEIM